MEFRRVLFRSDASAAGRYIRRASARRNVRREGFTVGRGGQRVTQRIEVIAVIPSVSEGPGRAGRALAPPAPPAPPLPLGVTRTSTNPPIPPAVLRAIQQRIRAREQ